MFKRIAKLARSIERDEAAGIPVGQDVPPEMRIDDSDSDSSDEESEEESEEESSDEEASGSASASGSRAAGKAAARDSEDEGADSDDDSEEESDDEAEDEDELGVAAAAAKSEPPLSIEQSLQSQIYVDKRAPKRGDFLVRSCVCCPSVQLKSDGMVEVHLGSNVSDGAMWKGLLEGSASKSNCRSARSPGAAVAAATDLSPQTGPSSSSSALRCLRRRQAQRSRAHGALLRGRRRPKRRAGRN
jgi:hypothetical protein